MKRFHISDLTVAVEKHFFRAVKIVISLKA